jgi:hypothetical protein
MVLNTHLINLLSVRERQRLDGVKTTTPDQALAESSFGQVLQETMASPPRAATDTSRVAQVDDPPPATTDTKQRVAAEHIMSAGRLVERFLTEQDLVLAAQSIPGSRYRNTPDDDTSGEQGVRANLRPID